MLSPGILPTALEELALCSGISQGQLRVREIRRGEVGTIRRVVIALL